MVARLQDQAVCAADEASHLHRKHIAAHDLWLLQRKGFEDEKASLEVNAAECVSCCWLCCPLYMLTCILQQRQSHLNTTSHAHKASFKTAAHVHKTPPLLFDTCLDTRSKSADTPHYTTCANEGHTA